MLKQAEEEYRVEPRAARAQLPCMDSFRDVLRKAAKTSEELKKARAVVELTIADGQYELAQIDMALARLTPFLEKIPGEPER